MAVINNYNITDFNQLEWNGLPYGDDSIRNIEKHIAFIEFDNGYKVAIAKSFSPQPSDSILWNIFVRNSNSEESSYNKLSETNVTNKLIEIKNL